MPRPRARLALAVEPLEGRLLLSQMAVKPPRVAASANLADGSGAGAILAALNGGAGSEFVTLIRRGVPNVGAVIRQFALGQRTQLGVKGFAVKIPKLQPAYTGPALDQFNPTAAGAVLLRDGRLELAAILRGPIDLPIATTFTWGIDRGAGEADPEGFGLPGIRYDAVVSVTRVGSNVSATVTDRTTGIVTPIDPASVKIEGPTIRVFLSNPSRLLPSTGQPIAGYRFAFWTRSGDGGLADVGGFTPTAKSLPIGVLGNPRPARPR